MYQKANSHTFLIKMDSGNLKNQLSAFIPKIIKYAALDTIFVTFLKRKFQSKISPVIVMSKTKLLATSYKVKKKSHVNEIQLPIAILYKIGEYIWQHPAFSRKCLNYASPYWGMHIGIRRCP